jgi:hypothetical protein
MAFCLFLGMFTAMIIGRTQTEFWIIYGGNTDPGDGQGGGLARDQMIAGGWTDAEHSYQVQWKADISQGTIQETDAAMTAGKDALNSHCGANRCVIAGFSLGTSPALQLSAETGHPADLTYIFGGPAPSTGIWHNAWVDNPWIEPAVRMFGQIAPDRFVPAGTQVFFDVRDPYANAAPQCSQPWALTLDGHRIITRAEASQRVWTGVDGAVNHEANYVPQPALPLSGNDPSPVWAGCYLNDWRSTPNSPGVGQEDTNRYPGIPAVPSDAPGAPAPALPGNGGQQLPSVPGLPTGG